MTAKQFSKQTKKVQSITSSRDLLQNAKELEKEIDIALKSESLSKKNTEHHEEFLKELKEINKVFTHA